MGFQDIVYKVGQFMGILPEDPQPVDEFYQEDEEEEYQPEQVYRTPYGQAQPRQKAAQQRSAPVPPTRQAWEEQQQRQTYQQAQPQQAAPFGAKRAAYPRDNVVQMPRSGQAEEGAQTRKHSEIIVCVRRLEDNQEIINAVLDGKSVFLNLEELDDVVLQRVIDMLGGAAFALRGTMVKISHRAYLIAPVSVDVVNNEITGHARRSEFSAAYRR